MKTLRRVSVGLVVILVLLGAGEWFARAYLGLGDPPLSVADPDIEYMFAPGDYTRFGNRVFINSHHMRSPERAGFDVLMIGDSVVNGGSMIDQDDLASSILAERLGVAVGNVSAGSWGPPNQLAYAERFGLFGAHTVVIVWSSHDAGDVPTFEPIVGVSRSFPDRKPVCALYEAANRYVAPRVLAVVSPKAKAAEDPKPDPVALQAAADLIDLTADGGARVVVVLHRERDEQADSPGLQQLADVAESRGATVVVDDLPAACYRDSIHLTAEGQSRLADLVVDAVSH